MYYYKSLIENQQLYSVIKANNKFTQPHMPYWYNLISQMEYDFLAQQKDIIVENDLQVFEFPKKWESHKKYFFIYNYYYLQLVHEIVNKLNCPYKWMNLYEWKKFFPFFVLNEKRIESSMKEDHDNAYLTRTLKDETYLGKDILKNGMYFPFFYQRKGDKEIPLFGSHRIYSLLKCLQENDDIKFLCIDLTKFVTFYYHIEVTIDKAAFLQKINFPSYLPCFCVETLVENSNLYKTTSNNQQICWEYFRRFNDSIGTIISNYSNFIKPNQIFNNINLWEQFIKEPFSYQPALELFN